MVAGLTTEEIARACHLPTTAIAQRIVRAKRTLRQHGVTFAEDDDVDVRARLGAVLDVIYLTFNEGYLPGGGETVTRDDLAREARRLACMLTELAPEESDTWSLRVPPQGRVDGAGGQVEPGPAEALTPLLHRYTVGNPRRVKRFLIA